MLSDEIRHKIFKAIEENPEVSQRELASLLGVSLGKTNFCLQALMEKGWIKMQNFKNNKNKLAYAYLLTPSGIEEKARLTVRYLRIKMQEYEMLKKEIENLTKEVEESIELPMTH
ncbi:MAG TPA: MarR family EPS-associated transcriptional regulator [Leptospiraceae bacterium]|nr:MarR family EPS-associated transcriptional regulator [Leptospiraceae bacterium]HMW04670.1 MarR family EPS-associated transcriptional regulator [Leptospiraceae bacterium]HMX35452.1 MarR family EPS-associated transcriptional regulator [Leptospiraceae bacterium]HMY30506.1 MarR family EPS-associated transcriptional regulator [Leptospiraceae bacterium]HMZ67087.1 MarR family EPS-associated transcriptional regulator [Leptospiraceae bacterium]